MQRRAGLTFCAAKFDANVAERESLRLGVHLEDAPNLLSGYVALPFEANLQGHASAGRLAVMSAGRRCRRQCAIVGAEVGGRDRPRQRHRHRQEDCSRCARKQSLGVDGERGSELQCR